MDPSMKTFVILCLTAFLLVKQVWLLPRAIATAARQRRQKAVLAAFEVERLDRLRNPSNYRGK